MLCSRKYPAPAPRLAAAVVLVGILVALPSFLFSITAFAGDEDADTGLRLYFAIPFIATRDAQPPRLGLQLLTEFENHTTTAPLELDGDMDTAIDLGFTRDGLAKFEVIGTDARNAYDSFARAIGLTPDEVELCRKSDCLDWVKSGDQVVLPATSLGQN